MDLSITHDTKKLCQKVLKEQLSALNISYTLLGNGRIRLHETLGPRKKGLMVDALKAYGIEILEDKKWELVNAIKLTIDDLIQNQNLNGVKVSTHLSKTMGYSYARLSTHFSEITHTSIENYMILRKIDAVKQLMLDTDLTLTEIAFRLNYSSVAHLSSQFKKMTGLTPSAFQRILGEKKKMKVVE